jgi:hypothetical protein
VSGIFHESVSPPPQSIQLRPFQIFSKFWEILVSQGAPPLSTTPVANFPPVSMTTTAKLPPVSTTLVPNLPPVLATLAANFYTIFASVVDNGGKFATGVNNTSDK